MPVIILTLAVAGYAASHLEGSLPKSDLMFSAHDE